MHLSKDNDKLIKRVRRLKGQLEGVERMLGEEADCYEILQRVAACRGAFNGLTRELIHEHIEASPNRRGRRDTVGSSGE